MEKYFIEKPIDDNGIFVLILKYTTLLLVTWIVAFMVIGFVLARKSSSATFLTNNIGLISLFIAAAVVFYYVRSIYNKYRLGSLFEITFDNTNNEIKISVVNTLNDKVKERVIKYENLITKPEIKDNGLTGKQRIINIYNRKEYINRLNIDLTAWCRHENIDELIENFKKFSS